MEEIKKEIKPYKKMGENKENSELQWIRKKIHQMSIQLRKSEEKNRFYVKRARKSD